MKTLNLWMLGCCSVLLFTQCSKQDNEELLSRKENRLAVSSTSELACNCQESSTKLTGTDADAWAKKFAPLLKFDRAAPDYPTSVEDVWAATNPASIVCGGKLILVNNTPPRSLIFPTYYEVQVHPTDANRIFVDYWWIYKRQENCIGSTGGHDYDLEHVVVQFNRSTQTAISVTYFQHAGWYTKKAQNVTSNGAIEVYVGKIAHGSYHFRNTISFIGYACSYWGDYRNPNGTKDEAVTGNNLSQMSCDITQFNFSGGWGEPGAGPLYRDRAYWNYTACKGTDGALGSVDGCSQSDYSNTSLIGSL
ncbi:hypothetical protein SAMN05428988_1627 [Chitinophaga sp. YR573]|uniref:hypothetical protein n=1 Tax=Chitinophaga sp. YR573 TaxID=1881040 RepID=UPI0008AB2525|nr:hypothetical protein [Chitinophaga sp. YR573]SEW05478.1 hypothetical protein SAMN05428988_1627 [Chitinophaga sp. YR573]